MPGAVSANWGESTLPAKPSKITVAETNFSGELWLNPKIGTLYSIVERITGPFATPLLEQAGVVAEVKAAERKISVLDLCCGTGVVSAHLQKIVKENNAEDRVKITLGDYSQGQLGHVQRRIEKEGWKNASAVQMNAMDTGMPDGEYTHVILAMALMLLPDPTSAVNECFRMLQPGGTYGISTWYYEAWNADVCEAIQTIPGVPYWPNTSDELINAWAQGPWEKTQYVKSQLQARGFVDVEVKLLSVHMPVKNAEDFANIYEAFIELIYDRYWTEAQRKVFCPHIREAVIRRINAKYGEGKPFTTERVNIMSTGRKPN